MDTHTNTPIAQPAAQNPASVFVFPTAGKIFAQAQEVYKTKFKSLIIISLCSSAAGVIASLISGQGSVYLKSAVGPEKITGIVLAVLVAILIFYISIWAFAATIRNISSPEAQTPAGKSFADSSHHVLPLIFTGLLMFLIIFGGLILLIIPGIILGFWYSQSYYVVITEGLSGKKALDQSKLYVKGNIWQIFKKGFFIGILSIIIAIAVAIIFGLMDRLLHLTFMTMIGNVIFQLLWTPLASVYAFMLFQYLRQSKAVSAPIQ